MNKDIRIACVGGYGHSFQVLAELDEMPGASLVAIAPAYLGEDLSMIKNHKTFNRATIKEYCDLREMLKNAKADIVIVSSRLDKIAESIIQCAQAHCHVIAEKPLALNHENLEKVYKSVMENNVKIMAMLSMRTFPAFIAAKEIYEKGIIGEAVLVNVRKSYRWGIRPDWFGDADKYGGTIGWIGIHAFDIVNFITALEFKTVAAMQSNFAHPSHKGCEDNCAIVAQLTNGGHLTASVDFLRPEASPVHGDDWIRLVGTKGIIEANASQEVCTVITNDGEQKITLGEPQKMSVQFISDIAADPQKSMAARLPFVLTSVCLHARDSARQERFVNITNKW